MTIKELLLLVTKKLSNYPKHKDDEFLSRILAHSTMYKRDWSDRADLDLISDIYFEYGTAKSFNIKQLEEELEPGYYLYYYVATEDNILIEYYKNKDIALKNYNKLNENSLICEKALVDTTQGIIACEKLV